MEDELVHREVFSPNCNQRLAPISMVVLHYTGMQTAAAALDRMCDPAAQVSAHYLIDEDGTVTRLVPEDKRAWHAGRSYWRGVTDVNSASIGIELVNPGHEWGYRPFPPAQMEALLPLLKDIVRRNKIVLTLTFISLSIYEIRNTSLYSRADTISPAFNSIRFWQSAAKRSSCVIKISVVP